MAISTTTNRVSYSGNGVTTVFNYSYKFLTNADLKVYIRDDVTGAETLKVLTTDYTVSGAGNDLGGAVTFLSAPASGKTVVIFSDPVATQELDLVENDSLPAEALEDSLDKLTLLIQRLKDLAQRTVKLSDGFSPAFNLSLPVSLDQAANKAVTVNATGDGFADTSVWPSTAQISAAQGNAAAAAASAAAALNSENAAAVSAVAAQAAVDSVIWHDVVFLDFTDSPFLIDESSRGKYYSIDCTAGNFVINLDPIANIDLQSAFVVAIKKTDASANTITINADAGDEIDGGSSKTITAQGEGLVLIPDTDPTPDMWSTNVFGAVPDNSVSTAKIQDGAVTEQKLASSLLVTLDRTFYRAVSSFPATVTDTDGTIVLSGASGTITLPTAVGRTSRKFRFIHRGTSLSQVYTIGTTSSQTIGGIAGGSYALYTAEELLEIESDGANWIIINHRTETPWVSWTPTGSWSANTTYTGQWKRIGTDAIIRYHLAISGTPTAANLTLNTPTSIAIDTSQMLAINEDYYFGRGIARDSATASHLVYAGYSSTTVLGVLVEGVPSAPASVRAQAVLSNSTPMIWASGDSLDLEVKYPVAGWQP